MVDDEKAEGFVDTVKELSGLAKKMGIKTKNIHATSVVIKTAEGKTLELDPINCEATVMGGMEEYGITFRIQAKIKKGKLKFD